MPKTYKQARISEIGLSQNLDIKSIIFFTLCGLRRNIYVSQDSL